MKIYIPQKAREGIGGGWTFTRNLMKALKDKVEFVNGFMSGEIYFISGCTLVQRDEVKEAKRQGKKVILRVDNVPRNSRNRNTSTSRLYDFAQLADVIIFQSEWARQWIKPFIKRDGIVILNGADSEIFKSEGDKIDKQGKPQWLYSRHNRDETKRWEQAWYHFQNSFYKNPNIHLWIVGQFSDRNREYNFNEEDLSKTFKLSAKGTKRLFSALKNTATRDKIEECLELANKLIKGHGILRIRLDDMNINILYINRRNIYKKTIIYDEGKKKFIIASWCDWFDEWESVNLNNIFS